MLIFKHSDWLFKFLKQSENDIPISVTRWQDYSYNFWPFTTMISPPQKKVAKVGWQFCQISNKPSKNCQRLIKFRQSDEISPNMVRAIPIHMRNVLQNYSMDCYFRQYWRDERLSFTGLRKNNAHQLQTDQLSLNVKMLEKIWKPDTYFHNGLSSYLHTITRPNKLLRISEHGDITYSMR